MIRLLTLICLFPLWCAGQNFQNTGIAIGLTEGSILKVNENFVNTGDLQNNGLITVGGSWVNTGLYHSDNKGILEMVGNGASISNPSSIPNLRLSNGNKILNTDLTADHLELVNSRLVVDEGFAVTVDSSITRKNDDYIIGQLKMTGNQFYPIGTEELFLPVIVEPITEDPQAIGLYAVGEKLNGPIGNTIAAIAPFHWVANNPNEPFNVTLFFENGTFLQDTIANAIVVQAEGNESQIINLYQQGFGGTLDSGYVSNAREYPVSMTHLSVGRKYLASENPTVRVLNLVSPNDDQMNDFLFIENIDLYQENLVSVYDRLGSKVFEVRGYDNRERVFLGKNNLLGSKELPDGTYYYVIQVGTKRINSGYLILKR